MGRRMRWSWVLALLVMLAFTACSKDDDAGNGTPSFPAGNAPTVNGKYLMKVGPTNIQYNAEGQVAKVGNMGYSYEPKRIIISPNDQIYYLTNGLITECRYTVLTSLVENALTVDVIHRYEYDVNGQLIKQTRPSYDYTEEEKTLTTQYVWQNGNIVKIIHTGEELAQESTISYTSYVNVLPHFSANADYGIDVYLEWQGYFGERCKNLPASITTVNSSGYHSTCSFDYVINDGLITKITEHTITTISGISYTNSYEYDLEWW